MSNTTFDDMINFQPGDPDEFSAEDDQFPARSDQFSVASAPDFSRIYASDSFSFSTVRIALYPGAEALRGSLVRGLRRDGIVAIATIIPPSAFRDVKLRTATHRDMHAYDLVAFPGGLGTVQRDRIGTAGVDAVRKFVADGGGYIGVCAGAYLALFPQSKGGLGFFGEEAGWLPNYGSSNVPVSFNHAGMEMLKLQKWKTRDQTKVGNRGRRMIIRYHNGPAIQQLPPTAHILASFNGPSTKGDLTNKPAVVATRYKLGRVLIVSPHPEGMDIDGYPALGDAIYRGAALWVLSRKRRLVR